MFRFCWGEYRSNAMCTVQFLPLDDHLLLFFEVPKIGWALALVMESDIPNQGRRWVIHCSVHAVPLRQ